MYARETGFVKSISVDRGSKVRQGEVIAELEAPELVAQRAQANAAYQSTESQLAAGQAKLAADEATYQHTRAAAKTPGVVAVNDLEMAQKTAKADEATVASSRENGRGGARGPAGSYAARVLPEDYCAIRWRGYDSVRAPGRLGRS